MRVVECSHRVRTVIVSEQEENVGAFVILRKGGASTEENEQKGSYGSHGGNTGEVDSGLTLKQP